MPKILCIDDDPQGSKIRRLLLESKGYQVIDAQSGPEGIALFNQKKIDLVILDYWMSEMNGLKVARQIRSVSPSTPVVMLSGYGELPGEALGLADRWIMKGRSPQELLDAVSELLQRHANS